MIPFIRSIKELMVITQPRGQFNKSPESKVLNNVIEGSEQRKKHITSKYKKNLELPDLPNTKREKWIKSKEAVSRFFDELDYNNQIQSSYDLTLLEIQINYDQNDVA